MSKERNWTSPAVAWFESPDEVWDCYKDKAKTTLELAGLALLLERWRSLIRERDAASRRRA